MKLLRNLTMNKPMQVGNAPYNFQYRFPGSHKRLNRALELKCVWLQQRDTELQRLTECVESHDKFDLSVASFF